MRSVIPWSAHPPSVGSFVPSLLCSPPLTTYTPRLPPIGRDFGISIAFFAHAQWLVTVSFVGDLLVTHGKESQAAGRMSDKLQDYGNPGGRYSVALIGDEEGYVACEKEKLTGGREGGRETQGDERLQPHALLCACAVRGDPASTWE